MRELSSYMKHLLGGWRQLKKLLPGLLLRILMSGTRWRLMINVPESHGDVVTTSEYPHDDLEDDEDDKNAKTRETPIYIVS